ncbi:MAG TPA: alpha-glucosidase/alpha-galactosidase, partial [Devosia sp.]|nr:alpha-glucosidase/alpha-galactosidase [Devosia sp.]
MISWAVQEAHPQLPYVGLCHSVQETAGHLARVLGEDIGDIDYRSAGINHVAFFQKFEKRLKNGQREDLYPRLKAIAEAGKAPDGDKVRFEVLKQLGYFVTESSEHFSEYTPWFIKRGRGDLVDKFQVPLDEYIRRCEEQIADWEGLKVELEDESRELEVEKSNEYAAAIIHGMVTGTNHLIYGNVRNDGLISNLPPSAAVEVPCHVDRNGIQPVRVGEVPVQLAAVMRWQINVQELTVAAALSGKREHIYHAAMMDPHTAAELAPDEIRALCDELITAHGNYLPNYR